MWKRAGLIVAVLAVALSMGRAYAGCGGDGCKATKACMSAQGTCTVKAALAKMDLTDEQKRVIAAAQAECAAAMAKAGEVKCPRGCAAAKTSAKQACQAKVKAVLTDEQQKALAEAMPSGKCCKAACPNGK